MTTQPDIVEEAQRLTAAAADEGVPVRLLGGLAIRLHADGALPAALERDYQDIDLVTHRKGGKAADAFLTRMGYEANERFNTMNAGSRMVFYDVPRDRHIDVFIGDFEMCHKIAIADRLDLDPYTVPLAELLLTKLQIVQLNRKDVLDIAAVLYGHDVAEDDDEHVNAAFVAHLLAGDWGLWRTVRGSIETTRSMLPEFSLLDDGDRSRVDERLQRLWERIEQEPKSLRWRSRAKVGDRARWYQDPEEIAHGHD